MQRACSEEKNIAVLAKPGKKCRALEATAPAGIICVALGATPCDGRRLHLAGRTSTAYSTARFPLFVLKIFGAILIGGVTVAVLAFDGESAGVVVDTGEVSVESGQRKI